MAYSSSPQGFNDWLSTISIKQLRGCSPSTLKSADDAVQSPTPSLSLSSTSSTSSHSSFLGKSSPSPSRSKEPPTGTLFSNSPSTCNPSLCTTKARGSRSGEGRTRHLRVSGSRDSRCTGTGPKAWCSTRARGRCDNDSFWRKEGSDWEMVIIFELTERWTPKSWWCSPSRCRSARRKSPMVSPETSR